MKLINLLPLWAALSSPYAVAEMKPPADASQVVRIFILNQDIESKGIGDEIGTIELLDTADGLQIHTHLSGLTPGQHGFHIHENPDCSYKEIDDVAVPGLSAGGHYDPGHSEQHLGPDGEGHLGDLPVLVVDDRGKSEQILVAPRLMRELIQNRSVIIHEAGDNYSDTPKKLGGGGARIACGIIQE